MSTVEEELPFVLSGQVSRTLPADLEFDVVVDFPVIDERAVESGVFERCVVLAICYIDWSRDQVVRDASIP